MRVKLCAQCPYTPRDLADRYDSEAALYLCATCDTEYDLRKILRRQTCQTRTINATAKTRTTEPLAALFARGSSASFAITAAAPPSVQEGASSISRPAGRATAVGCGDFELP